MNDYWQHKLALITGSSGGIGENISYSLAQKGIRVILVARNIHKLNSLALRIEETGGKAFVYPSDLSTQSARQKLYEKVIQELGTPDILINNVGIGWYGFYSQMPWEVAQNIIDLNIASTAHLISLFLLKMSELPRASIINIGSIAGKLPEQGIAMYSASKAFVDAFTKSLYRELRGTHVTASVIRAGPIKTDFFEHALQLPSGGQIPGELFAVAPERVSKRVWFLIQHPARFTYVPFYLCFSPLLEILFSWILDLIGPVLLRHSKNNS